MHTNKQNVQAIVYLVIFSKALLKLCCFGGIEGSGLGGVLIDCIGCGILSFAACSAFTTAGCSLVAASAIGGREARVGILGEKASILLTTSSTGGPGSSGGLI